VEEPGHCRRLHCPCDEGDESLLAGTSRCGVRRGESKRGIKAGPCRRWILMSYSDGHMGIATTGELTRIGPSGMAVRRCDAMRCDSGERTDRTSCLSACWSNDSGTSGTRTGISPGRVVVDEDASMMDDSLASGSRLDVAHVGRHLRERSGDHRSRACGMAGEARAGLCQAPGRGEQSLGEWRGTLSQGRAGHRRLRWRTRPLRHN
jgi:hypothetical protein